MTLNEHRDWVSCLSILQNGFLCSGSYDKTIKIWNINNFESKETLKGHTDSVRSLVV
jgi:WD40 repeat protein